jgi:hypothetical protein
VLERKSDIPARWTITIVPSEPKIKIGTPPPTPHVRAPAEDRY